MSLISQKHLQDEAAAYAWVEASVWPEGPVCPHCGSVERISKMQGKATRIGALQVLRLPQAVHREGRHHLRGQPRAHADVAAGVLPAWPVSKKGISANQLHRTLGVTLKTAWFMGHRIREAMRVGSLMPPMGGDGGVVEIDETIYGRAATHPRAAPRGRRYYNAMHKNVVLSLVERGGEVRSFHVEGSTVSQVIPIVKENVARKPRS